jgi:hypothetical protein
MSAERNDPSGRERGSPALRGICEDEWLEWYRLTPQERWRESERLWEVFRALGGSLDPEPDHQSPFYFPDARDSLPADGRPGVRVVRRSGV